MNLTVNAKIGRLVLAAVAIVIASVAPAGAEQLYTAVLTGSQEVPENVSPAIGLATLILNDAGTMVTYHVEYYGLLAPETAAHFHHAPSGVNGPVIFPLPVGTPKDGVWPVTPAQVAWLDGMEVYVNVHSTMFPGGEIRGNICFAAVDNVDSSWGNIKSLYRP